MSAFFPNVGLGTGINSCFDEDFEPPFCLLSSIVFVVVVVVVVVVVGDVVVESTTVSSALSFVLVSSASEDIHRFVHDEAQGLSLPNKVRLLSNRNDLVTMVGII